MSNVKREIETSIMGTGIKTSWYQVGNKRYPTWDDIPEEIRTAVALGDVHVGRGSNWGRIDPNQVAAPDQAPHEPGETLTAEEVVARIYDN